MNDLTQRGAYIVGLIIVVVLLAITSFFLMYYSDLEPVPTVAPTTKVSTD